MRIGIIRLSALGDIIVAMSVLPILKEKYPQSQIDWFVDERFGAIAKDCPYIDNLYILPLKKAFSKFHLSSIKGIFSTLKRAPKYDLLFDLQGLMKSALLGKFLKSNQFIGFDWNSIKEPMASLLYSQKVSIPYEKNILERNQKLLDLPKSQSEKSAFGYTQEAGERIKALLEGITQTKVLLVLEASKPQKMYPISKYAEVMNLSKNQGFEFLILYHTQEEGAKALHSVSGGVLLPKLNLDEVKALIDNVEIVIGGDTGVTHLAWAMKKASITLYGNTPMQRFILKGERNFALSGNAEANYQKDDFSIGKIEPQEIVNLLLRMRD